MEPSSNCNHPGLDWVVQKFGGTSIGKYAFQIAKDIIRDSLRRNRVAVVCSARSTTSKAAGTTTRLIEIFNRVDAARVGGARQQADAVDSLRRSLQVIVEEHIVGAAPSLANKAALDVLSARLSLEARNTVSAVTTALQAVEYEHGWAQDLVVSLGEKLSCLTMVAILQDLGVEAEYVDLSTILPPSSSSSSSPSSHDNTLYYAELSAAIGARLSSCGARVPVATGFFGPPPRRHSGMLGSGVGRGYTDLCAALAAAGLAAAELQVWKEVDGILTADPARVPGARVVPRASLREAAALARGGAEVVHAMAVRALAAAAAPIALRVRDVRRPAAAGTLVLRAEEGAAGGEDSDTDAASLKHGGGGGAVCRAIAVREDACVLHVRPAPASCLPWRAAAAAAATTTVEFGAPKGADGEEKPRRASFGSCVRRLLFPGRRRLVSSQSASIVTLVCSRADGNGRLAGQAHAILRAAGIPFALLPLEDDFDCISLAVSSPETVRAMNLLHDRLCLFLDE